MLSVTDGESDRARWIRSVAADATTIDERLRGDVELIDDEQASSSRYERWVQKVAEGDVEEFHRRLDASGWDARSARRALGAARWPDGGPLPTWAHVALNASSIAREHGREVLELAVPGRASSHFDALQAPFVVEAQRRLQSALRQSPRAALLDVTACQPAFSSLLTSLSSLAGAVNALEFGTRRRAQLGRLGEISVLASAHPGVVLYDGFERDALADGLESRCRSYPFLARRHASTALQTVAGLIELVDRRIADGERLAAAFGIDPRTPIDSVRPTDGDLHDGRAVLDVVFADGVRLAYKPRSIAVEQMWSELAEWLADSAGLAPIRQPRSVDSVEWGWTRWVESAHCETEADVAAVISSAGTALALARALGTVDLHYENVVVDGTSLHVVDGEMALQPDTTGLTPFGDSVAAAPHGVIDTDLLPSPMGLGGAEDADVGALAAPGADSVTGTRWTGLGTDAILRSTQLVPLERNESAQIVLNGELVDAWRRRGELIESFDRASASCQQHQEHLSRRVALDPSVPVRVIVRETWIYVRALRRLAEADCLRSGVDHQIQAEAIGLRLRGLRSDHPARTIFAAEVASLCEGSIPRFEVGAGSTTLRGLDVPIGRRSAIAAAHEHLGRLDDDDRHRQRNTIAAAMELAPFRLGDHERPLLAGTPPADLLTAALDAASRIGERLLTDAERAVGGRGLWWVGAEPAGPSTRRVALVRTGGDLYSGTTGIALAFAALWNATGERRWRTASIEALRRDLDAVSADARMYAHLAGLGAHSGAAGAAFALRIASRLTDTEELGRAADRLLDALAVLRPRPDDRPDVTDGLAGTILASLAATDTPSATHRDALAEWADALASAAVPTAENAPTIGWDSFDVEAEASFAHGAAGAIDALLAVAAAVPDHPHASAWRTLAGSAFDSLRLTLLDPSPLAPTGRDARRSASWCRGAVGHLCGIRLIDADHHSPLARTLRARASADDADLDLSLCCGLAGRMEFWRGRARTEAGPSATATALRLRERLVTAVASAPSVRSGRAPFLPNRPHTSIPAPGLLQGDAGVIWALVAATDSALPLLHG